MTGGVGVDYLFAFIVGGALCAIGQILMDATPLTPAHVLVIFVVSGVILTGLGLYQPLVEIGKAGATIPLTGFGHTLATGVIEEVKDFGILGVFSGLKSSAAGVAAAVVFGLTAALIFNPKTK